MQSMESYRHRPHDPSPDWFNQPRGRGREQSYRANFSSQDGFSAQTNFFQAQNPDRQPRRSRSADARPQYNRGSVNTTTNNNFFDAPRQTSYREANGFSSSPSRGGSNRAHSDVGVDGGMDSFRFTQIPKYEAVVHDDTMLYSRSERRRYRDGSSEDFLVLGNKSPARSPARPGQASYRGEPTDFVDRRQSNGMAPQQRQQQSYDQDRQYYNFARENLITFGGFDAQTASTGMSQEELLQRKQREEAFNKRKAKNKTKSKNRIINFPSGLLKSSSPQRSTFSQQNESQHQPSNYHKMSNLAPIQSNGHRDDDFDPSGNVPNPNGYTSGGSSGKGIRGSMVRRHQRKSKKSSNTDYDRGMNNGNVAHSDSVKSGNRSNDAKHTMYNSEHDYLLVQRDSTPHTDTTPKSRGSIPRPSYADFTPKSEYYAPRDLFSSQQKPYAKETSPTSVMDGDIFGNPGVRWNNNLTQEEFIFTPQSTKLFPDSQLRSSSGKPKSILRGRYSNASKVQNEDRSMSRVGHQFDDNPRRQPEAAARAQGFDDRAFDPFDPSGFGSDFMSAFVDQNGRDLSPIGADPGNDVNGKFPESYVHFVEAVAAVVIQTKVRQTLAKNRVQEMRRVQQMRNRAYGSRSTFRSSETIMTHANRRTYESPEKNKMTPMVRRSYALAKKVRQANEMKASKARKDVELDFYALAAIQIQAAFRGWWVRDCLGVDNYCATMIQRIYRGHRCRRAYLMDRNRVVMTQSVCRRWMAIDDAVTRIYCIVRIQAVMRGALVRKRMAFDPLQTYHAAATTIQTVWRSFWCEMMFLRAYEDILVVQSIVRGWIARKRFRAKLQAKNNRVPQRRTTGSRFQTSRFASKARKTTAYSQQTDYKKYSASASAGVAKPEISKSQPSDAKKFNAPTSAYRGSQPSWKAKNNMSKKNPTNKSEAVQTAKPASPIARTKSWKKPSNVDSNKIPALPVNTYAGKSVSSSRADIERRRKEKEQERQAKKEEENRRLESQNAGLAELELARRKMARKKEEKLRSEQQNEVTKSADASANSYEHGEEKAKSNNSDAKDSDYFDQVRKTMKHSNEAATRSSQQGNRFSANTSTVQSKEKDVTKSEEVKKSISGTPAGGVGGKEKSLVAKRREALMTSNGDGPSTTKESVPAAKPVVKSVAKVETKKEASPSAAPRSATVSTPKLPDIDVPERNLVTKSTYQKDMRKLRSESEQKRIDYMHHIFDQAGLMSRVK